MTEETYTGLTKRLTQEHFLDGFRTKLAEKVLDLISDNVAEFTGLILDLENTSIEIKEQLRNTILENTSEIASVLHDIEQNKTDLPVGPLLVQFENIMKPLLLFFGQETYKAQEWETKEDLPEWESF
jgi:hypothetical protein